MKTDRVTYLFCSLLCASLLLSGTAPAAYAQQPAAGVPASFAQTTPLMQYTAGGHILDFSSGGVYAASGSHALRVDFVGAQDVQPQGQTSANKNKAAPLNQVRYSNLWPGISLVYDAPPGSILRSTYQLAAGADVRAIQLRYNAPFTLNPDGSLNIAFQSGALNESAPLAWQVIDGKQQPVTVRFTQHNREVGFALGQYDARAPLTIDPSLTWNTFLGGSADDFGDGIAVDGRGNVYVVGESLAGWGNNPVRAYSAATDAFVAKLDTSGGLVWITFLGGSGNDYGNGIVVDGSGNIYVTGSSDAGWGNSPVRAYSAAVDTFAAKLDSSGNLTWNTFLGGSANDDSYGIVVDGNGNVYVVGSGSATWGSPLQAFSGGPSDAFAARLDTSGNLAWNTFLGGSGYDTGYGLAADSSGNIYIAGFSDTTWGSPLRAFGGGGGDAYAARLDPSGHLIWNTFLGGSGADDGYSIAADGNGNIYVTGGSDASWGSPVQAYGGGGHDGFAAKLDTSGNLFWNTFLGGSGADIGDRIAVDLSGNVYVAGHSDATWGNPLRAYSAGEDVFAAKLSPTGVLAANIFLGGSGYDEISGIAVDRYGKAYVTGYSSATWGSPLRAYSGGYDAFVAQVDFKLYAVSIAAQDGWLLESSETSGKGGRLNATAKTFLLGDDAANRQYRSILSFDTSSTIPVTATITSVVLKIYKNGLVGQNPFSVLGKLLMDISTGPFGGNSALQLADFKAVASAPRVGGVFTHSGNWYSAALTAIGRSKINTAGLTQLRLYFSLDDNNNHAADFMKFASGNGPVAFRPVLMVTFTVP